MSVKKRNIEPKIFSLRTCVCVCVCERERERKRERERDGEMDDELYGKAAIYFSPSPPPLSLSLSLPPSLSPLTIHLVRGNSAIVNGIIANMTTQNS